MVLASDLIDLCLDLQSSIYYYEGWVFQDFVYFIGLVRNQTLKEPLCSIARYLPGPILKANLSMDLDLQSPAF